MQPQQFLTALFTHASLVWKGCKTGECYQFEGVKPEKVRGKVFNYEGKCYQFELKPVSRDENKRLPSFESEQSLSRILYIPEWAMLLRPWVQVRQQFVSL